MKDGEFEVLVLDAPGISQGCKVCKEILKKGNFIIGVTVRENGTDFKYLLGAPPQEHCGEQKMLLVCFETIEEAQAEGFKIHDTICERGTTEGLPLMGFLFKPKSN